MSNNNRPPAHSSITVEPWGRATFCERTAIEAITALLWPLPPDGRLTVLTSLMAAQTVEIAESEDHIDAIVEVLRALLKQYLNETNHGK